MSEDLARPPFAELVRASNPGPMTLDGTNTWVLRAPGSDAVVVVDPGPQDVGHLEAVAARGDVALVLLTHGHIDHSEGAPLFHEIAGRPPMLAVDPALCRDGDPLAEGQHFVVGDVTVDVLATPGHTYDSACFVARTGPASAVLTGDTVLGRGTTVIAEPGGRLDTYLASLGRLVELGSMSVLPGHGPVRADIADLASEYLNHRIERLEQVRAARAGGASTVDEVIDAVYPDLEPGLRRAAGMSVVAQLAYLDDAG